MYKKLPWAVKLVINVVIIIVFLAALAVAGIAIYGAVIDVDFPTAWHNTVYWLGHLK